MPSLRIGSRVVSASSEVLVVAEIGVNHDGQVSRAIELVRTAREAGAHAIKLQVFKASSLVHGAGELAEYQKRTTAAASSADLLRSLELPEEALAEVLQAARGLGLLTIATPFSPGDVPVCARLGLDAIKIASPDVVNLPLVSAAARLGKPLLVSTGAASVDEIDIARRHLSLHDVPHCLLHCVSSYPAPDDQAHLCFIPELVRRYGELVGYSDHAASVLSGALAVAAGAVLLERHLTYDRRAAGPDHAASSDPGQFAQYVRLAREATTLRGTGSKRVLPIEADVRRVSRQSLVLTRDIAPGERLTPDGLTTQRPGTGIPASQADRVLRFRAKTGLKAGTLLTWDMLTT